MNRRMNRTQRNYIIIGLCMILLIMVAGYAAFSSQLKISGTSSISSSWNIQITNIETMLPSDFGAEYPDGYNISEPTYTPTSATFNAGFELPGSEIAYVVEVSNLGSIDGQVTIGNLNCGDNSAIYCYASAMDENPLNSEPTNVFNFDEGNQDYSDINFALKTGEKHYIMVMVGYADVTEQPVDLNTSIKLDLTYEQYKDPTIPVPSGETTLIGGQEIDIMSSGDGLYRDSTRVGRYVYKGTNPDNYILFNNELWRIVAKELDGTYKIVRNELLSEEMPFDTRGYRDSGSNGAGGTYCANRSYGCNAWAATANLVGSPAEFTNTRYTGTVLLDSSLNTYLNETYYNNLSSIAQSQIVSHEWGVGATHTDASWNDDSDIDLSEFVEEESVFNWNGKIGLLSSSDVYLSVSREGICGTYNGYMDYSEICVANNYLVIPEIRWWLISPNFSWSSNATVFIDGAGYRDYGNRAYESSGVRPAVFLSSSLSFSGEGTQSDPYVIE